VKLLLQRTHAAGPRTFGKLFADGAFLCYTLEDAVREIAGQPVAFWKVKGQTAIPSTAHTGRPYKVTLEDSPRFGQDTATIHGVPGFSYIRMHAGNTQDDTEGCPLLGMAISDSGIRGGTSRPAVMIVREAIRQGLREGGGVWIEVANYAGEA
jgi:hypothetical protein